MNSSFGLGMTEFNSSIYIWIDAICINQTVPEERRVRLQLMGHIYSCCDQAIIWLGDSSSSSSSQLAYLLLAQFTAVPEGIFFYCTHEQRRRRRLGSLIQIWTKVGIRCGFPRTMDYIGQTAGPQLVLLNIDSAGDIASSLSGILVWHA